MRRFIALAMALPLAGCQLAGLAGFLGQVSSATQTTPGALASRSPAQSVPAGFMPGDRLIGGLDFQSLTAQEAAHLDGQITPNTPGSVALNSAVSEGQLGVNAPAGLPASGMRMGPMDQGSSPYSYATYADGPMGQMRLASVLEAVTSGSAGSYFDLLRQVVNPVVQAWAPDARLVTSDVTLDAGGNLAPSSGAMGWHMAYASSSRLECMTFFITPVQTRVILLHWDPVSLDPATLQVDPGQAIASVESAIGDQGFVSQEDKLGVNYFLRSGDPVSGLPVSSPPFQESQPAVPSLLPPTLSPAPAPQPLEEPIVQSTAGTGGSATASATSSVGGTIVAGGGLSSGGAQPFPSPRPLMYLPKFIPLYHLEPGGTWNVDLEALGDLAVWSLSYQAYSIRPPEMIGGFGVPGSYEIPSASALVDARTGAIIRLVRPQEVVNMAFPVPSASPTPAAASPTPAAVADSVSTASP